MGQQIVYCNTCGIQILASEFEKGRAVTILRKNYCKVCMTVAVENAKVNSKVSEERPDPIGAPHRSGLASGESRRKAGQTRLVPRATPPSRLTQQTVILMVVSLIVLALLGLLFIQGRR
jgi:hypothetical protein